LADRVGLTGALADERHDQIVRDELARVHDRLCLDPQRVVLRHGGAKDLAGGDGGNLQPLREQLGLGPGRQLADLVEEQRTAVGFLEQ